jgi:hypothetical protein
MARQSLCSVTSSSERAPLSLAYRIPSYKLPDLTVRQISVLEVTMRLNGALPRDRI